MQAVSKERSIVRYEGRSRQRASDASSPKKSGQMSIHWRVQRSVYRYDSISSRQTSNTTAVNTFGFDAFKSLPVLPPL